MTGVQTCALPISSSHPTGEPGDTFQIRKVPWGPKVTLFPTGSSFPLFPLGPLFLRGPGRSGNQRLLLSPLIALRPRLPGAQNTVGVVVLDDADLTQPPGVPGGPGIPAGPRSPLNR